MDYIAEQREEIESLKSIFPDEFSELSVFPPVFMVRIDGLDISSLVSSIQLKITFSNNYPDECPYIEIPNRSNAMSKEFVTELEDFLRSTCDEYLGMPMILGLVNAAKDWVRENGQFISNRCQREETKAADADEESQGSDSVKDKLETMNTKHGGRWDMVIGLVGKPSAGKSSFFNAATQQNMAKIGTHPFTTIEPNIGKAFYSIPCPCSYWAKRCQAKYGHTASGERFIPVLLKDVAGLVPGACEGRGKGNKFLNDLLDADVLIHVIDMSGQTDEDGKPTTGYDPRKDVDWIQQELHRWIYDNITNKWDAIRKKTTKLYDMFTGYHASQGIIQLAFDSAGITDKKLAAISTIQEGDALLLVNKLVKEFLKLRFPILMALNKVDLADAVHNLDAFQTEFKHLPMVSVSAMSECILQKKCKDGDISYQSGSSFFDLNERSPNSSSNKELKVINEQVFQVFGDTGVLKALSHAVQLRAPAYAFPVHCLDTCQSISTSAREEPKVLRDCIVLKPGTTVGKLFNSMLHPPLSLLAGEYVRAECLDSKGNKKVLHKNELILDSNQIIKIMSTKKASSSGKSRN